MGIEIVSDYGCADEGTENTHRKKSDGRRATRRSPIAMLYLGLPAALATGAAGTGVDVSSTRSAALITIGDQWRLSVTLYRFVSVMLQIRVETCDTEENLRYRGELAIPRETCSGG